MSEKGKYSVVVQAKSGDRILTETTYPEQSYSDFVGCQYAIAMGLFQAGAIFAEAKGDPLPAAIVEKLGLKQ